MVRQKPLHKEKRAIIVLLGVALLLTALLAVRPLFLKPGRRAEVFLNGERVWTFQLEEYTSPEIVSMAQLGFDVPVSFELSEHRIRFVEVDCPDKLCEGFGFISLPTQTAVCMPNRVLVAITEG